MESEENRGSNFWFELKKEIPEPRKGRKKSAGRQSGRSAAADSARTDERTAADSARADERATTSDSAGTDERTAADSARADEQPQADLSAGFSGADGRVQDEQFSDADRGNRIPRTTEDGGQEEIH